MRPGFGAFVPRAARKQDAGGGVGGAAAGDAAAGSGAAANAAPGAASASQAKAAAAAAQAPAKADVADRGKRAQRQRSGSPRHSDKQQANPIRKQQHHAGTKQEQQQPQQQAEPQSPQHPKRQRARGQRQGGKHADVAQDTQQGSAGSSSAQPPHTSNQRGSLAAVAPSSAGVGSRRHRGRPAAPEREAASGPQLQRHRQEQLHRRRAHERMAGAADPDQQALQSPKLDLVELVP